VTGKDEWIAMSDDEIRFSFCEKHSYRNVFHLPGKQWEVEAVWPDAYYQAAKRLVEGVASGVYIPAYEGVAGLYLFRHYMELALKFVIFHSRWLRNAHANARDDEIADVKKTHALRQLWIIAKEECRRILPPHEWDAIDIEFVEHCVDEFDTIDTDGERFRYHGPRFGVEKNPLKREEQVRSIRFDLHVDFPELLGVIDHVHNVLGYLDMYMIETHGQNEEWHAYLRSL
jgi:hypothetical protein